MTGGTVFTRLQFQVVEIEQMVGPAVLAGIRRAQQGGLLALDLAYVEHLLVPRAVAVDGDAFDAEFVGQQIDLFDILRARPYWRS